MVNFGLLTAEICWRVWGTPANFNGFRVLAALLHGTLVVGVSQTLQRISHFHHSYPELIMRDRVERLLEVHEAHIEWLLMLACLVHQYS